jgi:hypothetical protein
MTKNKNNTETYTSVHDIFIADKQKNDTIYS